MAASAIDVEYLLSHDWWSRVAISEPDDCWLWKFSVGSHGYGQTWDGRTVRVAHRVAWTLVNGPIPEGLTIDHLCRVTRCCNPSHMRVVTMQVNSAANSNARKTHCKWGHEFTAANTCRDRRGHRYCRRCRNEYSRLWRLRHA